VAAPCKIHEKTCSGNKRSRFFGVNKHSVYRVLSNLPPSQVKQTYHCQGRSEEKIIAIKNQRIFFFS
jgi:hypothetical protein